MKTPDSPKDTRRQAMQWQAYAKAKRELARLAAGADGSAPPPAKLEDAKAALEAIRNELVERYLPMLRNIAERVSQRVPRGVELEDLLAEGVFGLMDAIDSYDPKHGVKFETFGSRRVHGAILDYLRSLDWRPRLSRMRQRQVEQVSSSFFNEHGRMPTDGEIVAMLPGKRHEAQRVLNDGRPVQMGSLEARQAMFDREHDGHTAVEIADKQADSPLMASHRKLLQEYVGKELSRAERLILVLNYYEGMTLAEVGRTLAISESRVSQMRTSILERLRARLDESAAVGQF